MFNNTHSNQWTDSNGTLWYPGDLVCHPIWGAGEVQYISYVGDIVCRFGERELLIHVHPHGRLTRV